MIPDPEHLTAAEYTRATAELRALHTRLVLADLAAVRRELAKLKTLEGKIEQRRRAATQAVRYAETARLADLIAQQHMRQNDEPPELGRQRLLAATAENFPGLDPDGVTGGEGPKGKRGNQTQGISAHGTQNRYQVHKCRCETCVEGKRQRNAKYQASRKQAKAA